MKKLKWIGFAMLAVSLQASSAQESSNKDVWIRKCLDKKDETACGYVDGKGKWRIEPGKYFLYTNTFDKIAIVYSKMDSDLVAIDRNEKVLFHVHIFDNGPDEISEGFYRIKIDSKYGFANKDGIAIYPKFDFVFPFSEGLAVVVIGCHFEQVGEYHKVVGGKWGYMDTNGTVLTTPEYEWAGSFEESTARVVLDKKNILVDKSFKQVGTW